MIRSKSRKIRILALIGAAAFVISCGSSPSGDGGGGVTEQAIPAANMTYVVLAWNDLGMHCLNPTYDKAVILPPYNTVWAQVVKRGDPPQIVTTGVTVQYAIRSNTYSYSKRSYGQFWDNCLALFGIALAHDTGLNLEDPNIHNGLSGTMLLKGDHFQVNGMPVVPVDDSSNWSPFQVADITVRDSGGAVIAQTRATVPTSDEINCARCHGADALLDVLQKHDSAESTSLEANRPVLCAQCHGSPALGQHLPGSSGKYLSQAIHGFHATKNATCYDCHPGATTKCSRSTAHMGTTGDGNCVACHGDMTQVASSIATGARVPWVGEPKCVTCHTGVPEVDTAAVLYRNSQGHGGLSCPACHQSPHAMVPSREAADNYQAIQYQTTVTTIGSCKVCHDSSKGEGFDNFSSAHGGSRATACSVCHTKPPQMDQTKWPHQFMWKAR